MAGAARARAARVARVARAARAARVARAARGRQGRRGRRTGSDGDAGRRSRETGRGWAAAWLGGSVAGRQRGWVARVREAGAGSGWVRGGEGGWRLDPVLRSLLDVAALGFLVGYVLVGRVHLPLLTVVELEDRLAHLCGEAAAGSLRSLRGRRWVRRVVPTLGTAGAHVAAAPASRAYR